MIDTILPVVTINGSTGVTLEAGVAYVESGAEWTDALDGSGSALVSGTVNTAIPGVYNIDYSYTDSAGNVAVIVTRVVIVVDTSVPVITLSGSSMITLEG